MCTRGEPRNLICLAAVSRGIYQIHRGICQILPRKTVGPIHDSPFLTSRITKYFPTSETEIYNLLQSLPNKQCKLDPIPTSLLKGRASILAPIITKIINLSLSTSSFPLLFKHSLVTLLFKKPSLDKETPSNYRPVSTL